MLLHRRVGICPSQVETVALAARRFRQTLPDGRTIVLWYTITLYYISS